MVNMDHFNKDRTSSPMGEDDEEEDGEHHEQIRLVATPDPSGQIIQTIDGIYHNLSADLDQFKECGGGGTHCKNEYYPHYFSSKRSKESSKTHLFRRVWQKSVKKCSPKDWILSLVPILSWLPKYKWKNDLVYDASAGFTVAVMNIPQGMAYALLSNVDPIVGLYMAFFPMIIYCILGTSRHVSVGTFAVICLMSGKIVSEKLAYYGGTHGGSVTQSSLNETIINLPYSYSATEIVTSVSLCVGIWQLILGCFQLGSLSVLLSDELISGFTTGCAVHVLTSQMKNLLGLKIPRRTGIFMIPLTYYDIMVNINNGTNTTAIILSLITISVLITFNEFIKPKLSKRMSFPFPMELLVIIIGTLVSRYWITSSAYGIPIVNHIPTGLPNPALPPLQIVPDVIVDSLIIAVVAYAISISMAKIFAVKHQYEVRPNQELIAIGSGNLIGSFFSCAPVSVSLTRSLIQEQVGGRTQVAGLFSCFIILFVLLWLAPFFETLPHCILSSLIVVALKGMFMQVADIPKFWKESRINGAIWMISFLATVFLDIEYGLIVGLLLTISSLLLTSSTFRVTEMGQHIHSNLFLEKTLDHAVAEIPGIKILKLIGSMNFVNAESAISKITAILEKNPEYELRQRSSSEKAKQRRSDTSIKIRHCASLILDFSSVSSVDPAAIKAIHGFHEKQLELGIQVFYVSCPSNVLQVMEQCKLFDYVNTEQYFSSIEHAVLSLDFSLRDHDELCNNVVISNQNNFNDYCLIRQEP